MKNKISL